MMMKIARIFSENYSGCIEQLAGDWKSHLASQDRMEMDRQLSCLPAPGGIWLFAACIWVKVGWGCIHRPLAAQVGHDGMFLGCRRVLKQE